MEKKRVVYLDLLRILACLMVICLHVSAKKWYVAEPPGYYWQFLNAYNSAVRSCVPLFVMLTGVLLLKREVNLPALKKNIGRFLRCYAVYSAFYVLVHYYYFKDMGQTSSDVLREFINGRYHLWFLPMIIGIYLVSPFLQKIAENTQLVTWFLKLFVIFTIVRTTLLQLNLLWNNELIGHLCAFAGSVGTGACLTGTYVGYAFLGHYLMQKELGKRERTWIYSLGVLGFALTVLLSGYYSARAFSPMDILQGYFSVTTLFEAAAIFVFFKEQVSKIRFGERAGSVIFTLSKCTLSVYLIHDFYLTLLTNRGFHTLAFNPILSVPVITLVIAALSFLTALVLRKIPLLNKFS